MKNLLKIIAGNVTMSFLMLLTVMIMTPTTLSVNHLVPATHPLAGMALALCLHSKYNRPTKLCVKQAAEGL